jgi:hypothetical protein
MPSEIVNVRDIRRLPFFWIERALLDSIRPSWKALATYNALAYFAAGDAATCRDIGIRKLAEKVSVSEDTIKRGLAELQEKGAIKIKERYKNSANGRRQQLPNEYILIDLGPKRKQPI